MTSYAGEELALLLKDARSNMCNTDLPSRTNLPCPQTMKDVIMLERYGIEFMLPLKVNPDGGIETECRPNILVSAILPLEVELKQEGDEKQIRGTLCHRQTGTQLASFSLVHKTRNRPLQCTLHATRLQAEPVGTE